MTTNYWKQDPLRDLEPSDLRMIQAAVKDYIDANDELHAYSPAIDWQRERANWVLLMLRIDQAYIPKVRSQPNIARVGLA